MKIFCGSAASSDGFNFPFREASSGELLLRGTSSLSFVALGCSKSLDLPELEDVIEYERDVL